MKRLFLLTVTILILFGTVSGQEDNTTYIKSTYPKIYAAMAKQAAKDFPGDYNTQSFTIDMQCTAFMKYTRLAKLYPDIPEDVRNDISKKAIDEWSKVPFLDVYPGCKDLPGAQRIDCVYGARDTDWNTAIFTMDMQFEAYRKLNK